MIVSWIMIKQTLEKVGGLMVFLENLLIVAGIGLDVFAAFEIQGAMMAQVKKRSLVIACAIVAALELASYFIGFAIFRYLGAEGYLLRPEDLGERAAVVVLAALGIRLIVKAIKREFVHEQRKDKLKVWDYIKIIIISSLYTLAAGSVSGLIGTSIVSLIVLILVISIVMVVGGVYTGFHTGFENKTFAYVAGAILLWGASIEILITKVLELV